MIPEQRSHEFTAVRNEVPGRSGDPARRHRVALITGASSGIGRATAVALSQDVGAVVIHYNTGAAGAEETATEVARNGAEPFCVRGDLVDPEQVQSVVKAVIDRYGRVDILVNNAGGVERIPILSCTPEKWRAIFQLNLDAVFFCTQALLPGMIERGWGRVINVSSMVSLRGGHPQETVHYAAAKAALNVYSQGLARAIAKTGVTVNVVAPGFVDTPLQDKGGHRPVLTQRAAATPIGRSARPDEIAAVIRFIASDAASYLIGEVVTVSGGI